MTTTTAWLVATWRSRPSRTARPPSRSPRPVRRAHGDRGEGAISVAIAVLIMAFLGAAMWLGFQSMWQTTSSKTDEQVSHIGEP
jgi:hypothetical protein